MKKLSVLLAFCVLAAPTAVLAAKVKPAKQAKPGKHAKNEATADFAKYDTNKNGTLDPEEYDAVRKDFAANPKGGLAKLDTDGDGNLSDQELAAFKASPVKSKGEKGAKKNKKNAAPTVAAATPPAVTPADSTTPTDPTKKPEDPK